MPYATPRRACRRPHRRPPSLRGDHEWARLGLPGIAVRRCRPHATSVLSLHRNAMLEWLYKERIVAAPGFNRWRVPPASISIHLCIGSVYAWSIFNQPLTRLLGVVASAPGDWSLDRVVWVFSVAIVFLGL